MNFLKLSSVPSLLAIFAVNIGAALAGSFDVDTDQAIGVDYIESEHATVCDFAVYDNDPRVNPSERPHNHVRSFVPNKNQIDGVARIEFPLQCQVRGFVCGTCSNSKGKSDQVCLQVSDEVSHRHDALCAALPPPPPDPRFTSIDLLFGDAVMTTDYSGEPILLGSVDRLCFRASGSVPVQSAYMRLGPKDAPLISTHNNPGSPPDCGTNSYGLDLSGIREGIYEVFGSPRTCLRGEACIPVDEATLSAEIILVPELPSDPPPSPPSLNNVQLQP